MPWVEFPVECRVGNGDGTAPTIYRPGQPYELRRGSVDRWRRRGIALVEVDPPDQAGGGQVAGEDGGAPMFRMDRFAPAGGELAPEGNGRGRGGRKNGRRK